MVIALALMSAALFGTGVALMQRPAAEVPAEFAARPGLLVRVIRQPIWLVGVAAEIAGFVLQLIALRHGSLVVVQPLLTTSLLFTIALVGTWTRQGVTAAEWAALIAVVAGPGPVHARGQPQRPQLGFGRSRRLDRHRPVDRGRGRAAGLVRPARLRPLAKAATLGLAAGLSDAFMAVMTKAFAHVTDQGLRVRPDLVGPLRPVRRRPDRHAAHPDGLPGRAAEGLPADHHRRRPAGQLRDRGGPLR